MSQTEVALIVVTGCSVVMIMFLLQACVQLQKEVDRLKKDQIDELKLIKRKLGIGIDEESDKYW